MGWIIRHLILEYKGIDIFKDIYDFFSLLSLAWISIFASFVNSVDELWVNLGEFITTKFNVLINFIRSKCNNLINKIYEFMRIFQNTLSVKQPIGSNPLKGDKDFFEFNSSRVTKHFTERASSVDSDYSTGDRPGKPSNSANPSSSSANPSSDSRWVTEYNLYDKLQQEREESIKQDLERRNKRKLEEDSKLRDASGKRRRGPVSKTVDQEENLYLEEYLTKDEVAIAKRKYYNTTKHSCYKIITEWRHKDKNQTTYLKNIHHLKEELRTFGYDEDFINQIKNLSDYVERVIGRQVPKDKDNLEYIVKNLIAKREK
jgi:hypothetical protein